MTTLHAPFAVATPAAPRNATNWSREAPQPHMRSDGGLANRLQAPEPALRPFGGLTLPSVRAVPKAPRCPVSSARPAEGRPKVSARQQRVRRARVPLSRPRRLHCRILRLVEKQKKTFIGPSLQRSSFVPCDTLARVNGASYEASFFCTFPRKLQLATSPRG